MNKKGKIIVKVIIGIAVFVLLAKVLTIAFVEPWLEKKIETALQEKYKDYRIEIDRVNILFFPLGLELESVMLRSQKEIGEEHDLKAEIRSVKLLQLNIRKYLSDKDIEIGEVRITDGLMKGEIPESKEKKEHSLSPINIQIHKLLFSNIELEVKNASSPQTYSVKDGLLHIYDLQIKKQDTISSNLIQAFDFKAGKFLSVLADSMYTITACGIEYSGGSKKLSAKDLIVHPNYSDYEFTARKKYQTDCIRATLNNISFHDFSVPDYLKHKNLICSYIEVEQMDMHVFRDKRKEFHHIHKKMFQQMIYDYHGKMKIDSIGILNGNVTYAEHVEMAVQPGTVNFTKIHAMIHQVSNDTFFKKHEAFLTLKGQCYFMGKAKMTVGLKARLYDPNNTFFLTGGLSAMEAKEVNPMLEKNAFIFVTAGKIDAIHFSMRADNFQSIGKITMLYHELDVAVKSKKSNDTTAIKARVISLVANKKIIDSNPEPGESVREGMIHYERDPEKFVFNYCFKSILSGMKATLAKNIREKKHKKK